MKIKILCDIELNNKQYKNIIIDAAVSGNEKQACFYYDDFNNWFLGDGDFEVVEEAPKITQHEVISEPIRCMGFKEIFGQEADTIKFK